MSVCISQYIYTRTPSVRAYAQTVLLGALKAPEAEQHRKLSVERYARVRAGVTHLLSKVPGIRCVDPAGGGGAGEKVDDAMGDGRGGLYVAVDVTALGVSAEEVADVLLDEARVSVVPVTFGRREMVCVCVCVRARARACACVFMHACMYVCMYVRMYIAFTGCFSIIVPERLKGND